MAALGETSGASKANCSSSVASMLRPTAASGRRDDQSQEQHAT